MVKAYFVVRSAKGKLSLNKIGEKCGKNGESKCSCFGFYNSFTLFGEEKQVNDAILHLFNVQTS